MDCRPHAGTRQAGARHAGTPVLPRLAYALGGGWAAWAYGGPLLAARWQACSSSRPRPRVLGAPPRRWRPRPRGSLLWQAPQWVGWRAGPLNFVLGRAFRLFNDAFARATSIYLRGVGMLLRTSAPAARGCR